MRKELVIHLTPTEWEDSIAASKPCSKCGCKLVEYDEDEKQSIC